MTLRNRKKDLLTQGGMAFRVLSAHIIMALGVFSQIAVFLLSVKGTLFPGSETMLSIISTCAQIIAGLYGITMAGYTFFLSRMDALSATDTTLDYVVASIKTRFKYLIWYITFNVLVTLFISIFLMYCPAPSDPNQNHAFFYRLFCNEFVVFLGYSTVLILYYSILVIDPNCLEKEAAKLKKRISRPVSRVGSVTEFISLYDEIETRCSRMIPRSVLAQIHENKGRRFEYTIGLLQDQNLLPRPLISDLSRIHRYYECMINCTPLSVTAEMCALARTVLSTLEQVENTNSLMKK